MADPHTPDWLGPGLGALATALTGLLAFLGVRAQANKPKADPQEVQNEGWDALLNQMRTELVAASRERNHLNRVLEEERRGWRDEREAWRVEREAFMGEIHQLQAVAEGFERLLRRNGIMIPMRGDVASEAQVVGATLHQVPPADD
jgi:hypothetical protein